MASPQEKLDAIYQFERSRREVDRARQDEDMIDKARTLFLDEAKRAAKAGGSADYQHFFPVPYDRLIPEIVRRLRAEGYRVKQGSRKQLVIEFIPPAQQPPADKPAGQFSLSKLFGRG